MYLPPAVHSPDPDLHTMFSLLTGKAAKDEAESADRRIHRILAFRGALRVTN
jgi:hypothetical protein